MSERLKNIPWWGWVLGVDSFLVVVVLIKNYAPPFPLRHIVIIPFNLAAEMNIAVWWSSIILLLIAMLSYERYSIEIGPQRRAWLALSLVFLALFADELGSFHERIDEWETLAPFGLVGGAIFVYAITRLNIDKKTRKSSLLIFCGMVLFGLVVVQEYIEHTVSWPQWAGGLRTAVEEGTELFAMFLCLLGVIGQRESYHSREKNVFLLLPALEKHNKLVTILLVGFVLHLLIVLIMGQLQYQSHLGNPVVLYPTVIFFILSIYFTQLYFVDKNIRLFFMAVNMLILSIGSVYVLPFLLPGITRLFSEEQVIKYYPYIFNMYLLVIVSSMVLTSKDKSEYLLVLALILAIAVDFYIGWPAYMDMLTGLISLCVLLIVYKKFSPEKWFANKHTHDSKILPGT